MCMQCTKFSWHDGSPLRQDSRPEASSIKTMFVKEAGRKIAKYGFVMVIQRVHPCRNAIVMLNIEVNISWTDIPLWVRNFMPRDGVDTWKPEANEKRQLLKTPLLLSRRIVPLGILGRNCWTSSWVLRFSMRRALWMQDLWAMSGTQCWCTPGPTTLCCLCPIPPVCKAFSEEHGRAPSVERSG